MLFSVLPLQDDKKDVLYDVESLLTNIPIVETIKYTNEQIYVYKNLTLISWKMIFRRMFIKLTIECTFEFNSRFFKEEDGRTIGGPLFATFSDIYMVKMENNVVTSYAHIFYCRFIDDIYSGQKLGENVLFE